MRGFTLIELLVFIVSIGLALTGMIVGVAATSERSVDPLFRVRATQLAYTYLEEIMSREFDENDTAVSSSTLTVKPDPDTSSCGDPYFGDGCTQWAGFGPDSGETRASFDDVDDYHLLVEGSEQLAQDGSRFNNPSCTGFSEMGDLGSSAAAATAAAGPPYTASPTTSPRDAREIDRPTYFGFCVEVTVHYDGDYDGVDEFDATTGEPDADETLAKRIRIRVSHPSASPVTVTAYRAGY